MKPEHCLPVALMLEERRQQLLAEARERYAAAVSPAASKRLEQEVDAALALDLDALGGRAALYSEGLDLSAEQFDYELELIHWKREQGPPAHGEGCTCEQCWPHNQHLPRRCEGCGESVPHRDLETVYPAGEGRSFRLCPPCQDEPEQRRILNGTTPLKPGVRLRQSGLALRAASTA